MNTFVNGPRYEWAAFEARNTVELAEVLSTLSNAGYTIQHVLNIQLKEPGERILYTVTAVRERAAHPGQGSPT